MVERSVKSEHGHGVDLFLPPGFRFHPTDEEVITSYLLQKFLNPSFSPHAIGEVNLNKCEPWDLPYKAKMGEKEWYFFCHKDMKYPTGTRTNRATKEGYWKATGKDREIFKQPGHELVGMKKTLVFYMGRAPRGTKTNWVMHEFRLHGNSNDSSLRFNPKDEWVVCKVHHKGGDEVRGKQKVAGAGEEPHYSSAAGTPNVSSVEPGEGAGDEFLVESLLDYSSYFNSSGSAGSLTLPATTTSISAAATPPPYNADCFVYPVHTHTTAAATGLPTDSNSQHTAVASSASAAATNNNDDSSASWNMLLHATPNQQAAAMGTTNYSLQHQAMVAKALGGGVGASSSFAAGGGLPGRSSAAAAAAGIAQNVLLQQRLAGNYGGNYAAGYHTSK